MNLANSAKHEVECVFAALAQVIAASALLQARDSIDCIAPRGRHQALMREALLQLRSHLAMQHADLVTRDMAVDLWMWRRSQWLAKVAKRLPYITSEIDRH